MKETKELSLQEKLADIQYRLQAPKDSRNDFGGFNYRSAEGILTALKPLLKEHGVGLIFHDSIEVVGERYYVRSCVEFFDPEKDYPLSGVGWAREPEHRTKSDDAQVTGASISYAHKYALGALFAIDDASQDVDAIAPQSDSPKKEHSEADVILWEAVKQYSDIAGYDPKWTAEKIKQREDYDGSDECKLRIAEELRSEDE